MTAVSLFRKSDSHRVKSSKALSEPKGEKRRAAAARQAPGQAKIKAKRD